jgi:hypothetical protein
MCECDLTAQAGYMFQCNVSHIVLQTAVFAVRDCSLLLLLLSLLLLFYQYLFSQSQAHIS